VASHAGFEDELARALEELPGLSIPPAAIDAMAALDAMLVRWSAKLDLVGFGSAEDRVRRYFAEPLAASPWFGTPGPKGGEALDIGSGGGSPALPLALLSSSVRWTLLESRRRKALFLEEAARLLGLENVSVRAERFVRCSRRGAFARVTTRGVRLSASGLEEVTNCLRPGGRLLWFSSESRLREAARALSPRVELRVQGPERLLSSGGGRLLVVERAAGAGECST
jgi:16S rRNA (guanine527-N7)-methyltransferase